MGTLKGFPNPPALWLWRAKPAFAYAIMGTLKGFPNPTALWLRRATRARVKRAGWAGWAVRPEAPAGGARLRQRDDGNPERVRFALRPTTRPTSLRSALPNPAGLPLD